ncbi:hypothetical protein NQ176_g2727 [Zarea fungicola]|uniref:Uncharacterized protein n=1 Tax=Zarea fungicola TaxID=93591 RepID=A0ACC1NN17_9HYPO|nr:hypothetical protein NQ176_g2727 [Lecanicillium fungicola]
MRLLILGGTSFVGRAIAVEAVSRNHTVTLLHRGTKPSPDGVTTCIGDRLAHDGLDALNGMHFDAVLDTWAADAAPAIHAMEKLKGRFHHYTFISTITIYDRKLLPSDGAMFDENTAVFDVTAPDASKSVYEFNKRTVEIAAGNILRDVPCVLARAGVILGPHEQEYTERGRLLWWLDRLGKGGRVVAPEPRDLKLQFVDARDLAKFVVDGAEQKLSGAFNIAGEAGATTMGELLEMARQITGGGSELVWTDSKRIMDAGVVPFMDLPLWLDPKSDMYRAIYCCDATKAKGAGLVCRPVEETVRDTWDWMQGETGSRPAPNGVRVGGLSKEKESILLG